MTNRFLLYMALGALWVWAKYSHGVWERSSHQEGTFLTKTNELVFCCQSNVQVNMTCSLEDMWLLKPAVVFDCWCQSSASLALIDFASPWVHTSTLAHILSYCVLAAVKDIFSFCFGFGGFRPRD